MQILDLMPSPGQIMKMEFFLKYTFLRHTPHMSVTRPVKVTDPVPPEADLVPLRCTFMRALLNISCALYQIKGSGYLYVCVTGQGRSFVLITVRRLYMVITSNPQSRLPGQHVQNWYMYRF